MYDLFDKAEMPALHTLCVGSATVLSNEMYLRRQIDQFKTTDESCYLNHANTYLTEPIIY